MRQEIENEIASLRAQVKSIEEKPEYKLYTYKLSQLRDDLVAVLRGWQAEIHALEKNIEFLEKLVKRDAFTFWLENKATAGFRLTAYEVTAQFDNWLKTKTVDYLNNYSEAMIIRQFITGKDGLNSVSDNEEFKGLCAILGPSYLKAVS